MPFACANISAAQDAATDAPMLGAMVAQLGSDDATKQLEAIFYLGEKRADAGKAIDGLVGLLGSKDNQVRWAAAWALSQIGDKAVEPVGKRLGEPDVAVRRAASYVLAQLTPDKIQAHRLLLPAVADSDPLVRHHAKVAVDCLQPDRWDAMRAERHALRIALLKVYRLEPNAPIRFDPYGGPLRTVQFYLGPVEPAELPELIKLLDDPSFETRGVACLSLRELGPLAAAATPKLAELLETQVPVADAAMRALEAIGPEAKAAAPAVLRRLVRTREDANDSFKVEVALLGKFGRDATDALPALVAIVKEHHGEQIRQRKLGHDEAVVALAQVAAEPPPELFTFLDDKFHGRREAGARALGAFGPRAAKAVPRLIAMLRDENEFAAVAALVALEQIGPPAADAIPVLAEIVRKENTGGTEFFLKYRENLPGRDYPHPRLIHVIGKLGPKGLPVLIEFLDDKEEQYRSDAAIALAGHGRAAREALPKLVKIAQGEEYATAQAAIAAIGALGPEAKSAIPALITLLEDEIRQDRIRALLTALVRIDARDEQVQATFKNEWLLKGYWFQQTAPSVLFDEGLLTEDDLWQYVGLNRFPLAARDPRWPKFVADHVPFLLRCLKDNNDQRRRWGAATLRFLDERRRAEIDAVFAENLDNETARNMLVMGRPSGEGTARRAAVPYLVRELSSRSETQRRHAVEILAQHYSLYLQPREKAIVLQFVAAPPDYATETAKKLAERLAYYRIVTQVRPYSELVSLAATKPTREAIAELSTYGAAAVPAIEKLAINTDLKPPFLRTVALRALADMRTRAWEASPALAKIKDDAKENATFRAAAETAIKGLRGDDLTLVPRGDEK